METNRPDTNIYEATGKQEELVEEAERLRSFNYPAQVSVELLQPYLEPGKKFLDVGAGENSVLGDYLRGTGMTYLALDTRESAMQEQQTAGALAVVGKADKLPFADSSVDVSHTRFVLAWLKPEVRHEAITESLRVASERAVYLDYDWGAMGGTEEVETLRDLAVEVSAKLGFDGLYGQRLKADVEAVVGGGGAVTERRYNRGPGDYTEELKMIFTPMTNIAKSKLPEEESVQRLAQALADFETAAEQPDSAPRPFTVPDIVAVEVAKN